MISRRMWAQLAIIEESGCGLGLGVDQVQCDRCPIRNSRRASGNETISSELFNDLEFSVFSRDSRTCRYQRGRGRICWVFVKRRSLPQ